MSAMRIAVVDDSETFRAYLQGLLVGRGELSAFDTAGDCLAALADPAQPPVDLVLMDLIMPGMDGLACLKRIMVEHPKPVVMVSALTAEGAEVTLEALRLGAVEAVRKPTGVSALAAIAE